MQLINIYNKEWQQIGCIDAYTSLIWCRKFIEPGSFELEIPFTTLNAELLQVDHFVELAGTETQAGKYAMIIERIEITQKLEDGIIMLVSGRDLTSILARRVLYTSYFPVSENGSIASKKIADFISDIIDLCFGSQAMPQRRWGKLIDDNWQYDYAVHNATSNTRKKIWTASGGENLLNVISQALNTANCGIETRYSGDNLYDIYLVDMTNRSETVVFSRDNDNFYGCSYVLDNTNHANVARITNSITDASNEKVYRIAPSNENTIKYLDRYETDLSCDLGGDGQNSINAMVSSATRQLRHLENTKEINAEIITTSKVFVYNVDYYVGDIVRIKTDFGITIDAQLVEMCESWDNTGYNCIPTFSNYIIMED